jgi:hypothetical protein
MSPEASLLFAIFKQIMLDYMKLDPDSDCVSADYFESEADDYQVAENIIFYKQPIYFGGLVLTFDDLVELFQDTVGLTPKKLKQQIVRNSIEY